MAKASSAGAIAGPSEAEQAKWRAESDLRALVEAETIRKDSKRLAAAKKLGRDQAAALRKVTGNG